MKFVINRFEGDLAVLETNEKDYIKVPRAILPNLASDGDVIDISIDEDETERRRERMKELMGEG